jgi:hypothetical protein
LMIPEPVWTLRRKYKILNLDANGARVIQLCRTVLIIGYSVFSQIPTQYILIE